ncbi:MAG: hypothetical protein KJ634_05605 [Gammaproteobacteria bacterium]|nr:hypothetical protein [Gammaproteobacteria bacterium]MBU1415080.1 hypothetical protein [Gammaproteobacteria bacterium]
MARLKLHHIKNPTFRHQGGLALLVALIVLVAMSLAGVALIRSVDTNTMIASNLAFRQSAREGADARAETALAWLVAQTTTNLESNHASDGYLATISSIDLTGNATTVDTDNVQWQEYDGSTLAGSVTPVCASKDAADNVVCYIIERMCDSGTSTLDPATCDTTTGALAATDESGYGSSASGLSSLDPTINRAGIYRVTIRASGPRNNASFVQVFLAVSTST